MIGRSLLPFGDTFAVLMIVFLILSLSVGSSTLGPEGSSDREPVVIVVGNSDPFEVEADGFLGVSSNATNDLYWQNNRSRPVKIERFVQYIEDVSVDANILAARPHVDIPESLNEDIFQDVQPWVEFEQERIQENEELYYQSLRSWDIFNSGDGYLSLRIGTHYWPQEQSISETPELFAISNGCTAYEPVFQDNEASSVSDVNVSGFGNSTSMGRFSVSLDADRSSDIVISGLFEAISTTLPMDEMVDQLGYFQSACFGYRGHDPEAFADGQIDTAAACHATYPVYSAVLGLPIGDFPPPRDGVDVPSPPLHLSKPRGGPLLVTPRTEKDRTTVGELATHALHPRPIHIAVYLANGDTRLFRTPTWWEMFRGPVGLRGVTAYQAGRVTCETLRPDFEADEEEAIRSARVFEFRLRVRPNGQIDHFDTLISVDQEGQ
ncbi:MAG: hypothetical protein AAF683_01950 [Pseudomonadota bacterium]